MKNKTYGTLGGVIGALPVAMIITGTGVKTNDDLNIRVLHQGRQLGDDPGAGNCRISDNGALTGTQKLQKENIE